MSDWDVDKYKSPHEPGHQWALRRKFMVQNKDRYDELKVVCLGQTFANIEFMGCRYPKETMELVEELAFGVVQEYREQQKGRLKRTFVGAADAAGAKVNRGSVKLDTGNNGNRQGAHSIGRPMPVQFVKASTSSDPSSQDVKVEHSVIQPPLSSGQNREGEVTRGDLRSKLDHQRVQRLASGSHHNSQHSAPSFNNRRGNNFDNRDRKPRQFILVKLSYNEAENAPSIITRSAQFSKVPVEWQYKSDGRISDGNTLTHECTLRLGGMETFTEKGINKKDARDNVGAKVLALLERECYTVLVKNKYLGDGSLVELPSATDPDAKQPQGGVGGDFSNVGHKLLKLMGWSGGGLGKGGQGISEPITAAGVTNRQGFGSASVDQDFKFKMKKLVQEYALSTNPYDLVFASDFSTEERAVIHEVSRKMNLKAKSYGKGEDRFITVSRKFDSDQLIRQLMERGGENEKYELIPPSNESLTLFKV